MVEGVPGVMGVLGVLGVGDMGDTGDTGHLIPPLGDSGLLPMEVGETEVLLSPALDDFRLKLPARTSCLSDATEEAVFSITPGELGVCGGETPGEPRGGTTAGSWKSRRTTTMVMCMARRARRPEVYSRAGLRWGGR